MGEDRGEQRAHLPGVDPLLAGLLEVDAEPEVVLDLDEQVREPDRAAAGVQPAVQLGQALRLRRAGLPAEVLRAVDGKVAGLDLVAHLEEQRAPPSGAGPSRRHGG